MQQYAIELKNEKIRLYNRISWLIIFAHLVIFVYLAFFSHTKSIRSGSIASLVLAGIGFIAGYYLNRKRSTRATGFHIFYSILIISWILIGWYWLAAVPCVFYVLYALVSKKLITILTEEKIVYPSFPVKMFNWHDLNNVVLKDGLLTIDIKPNKLIQQITNENSGQIDEKEFNDFCKKQLAVK